MMYVLAFLAGAASLFGVLYVLGRRHRRQGGVVGETAKVQIREHVHAVLTKGAP